MGKARKSALSPAPAKAGNQVKLKHNLKQPLAAAASQPVARSFSFRPTTA